MLDVYSIRLTIRITEHTLFCKLSRRLASADLEGVGIISE